MAAAMDMAAVADDTEACASGGKDILYDMPVSNNGARCRMIAYYKGIEGELDIVPPTAAGAGGLRSAEYKALNPQGKMPLLVTSEKQPVAESDTIARYMLDKWSGTAPSLIPNTLAERTLANAIARHHDMYIQPIQGSMYKGKPPFGRFGTRTHALEELRTQLAVLEDLASETGPFLAGAEPSLADCTIFPTAVFLQFMLPKYDWTEAEIFGPKLQRWWQMMCEREPGKRVLGEIQGALEGWDAKNRWDTILGAGLRDTAEATIFDKIIAKEIPSDIVYEDNLCLAFRDIAPQAPTHILVIPKVRAGLTQLQHASAEHQELLGHLLVVVGKVAKDQGIAENGYRVVINDGVQGAQTVFHLHVHIIGGRAMNWPPG